MTEESAAWRFAQRLPDPRGLERLAGAPDLFAAEQAASELAALEKARRYFDGPDRSERVSDLAERHSSRREAVRRGQAEPPRDDLVRMLTGRLEFRAEDEDGGTLFGYAAVFDTWTEINSWEGRFRERIAPGAFRKTLRERRDKIKVLFNHGMDPQIGDKPLGKPRVMREDEKGLYVEVPLDDTSYNADIKALLRSGALDGMSFRMSVVGEDWDKLDDDLPERTIREIKLFEFGPVTFPAYEATQAGVRAHAPQAFEAWRSRQESKPEPPAPEKDPGRVRRERELARIERIYAESLEMARRLNPDHTLTHDQDDDR